MVGAVLLGERRLLLRPYRADDGRAQMLAPLAQDEADAARSRVDQDGVAFLDLVDVAHEVLRGHAFEHHAGRLLVGDRIRKLDRPIRGQQPFGRVAARAGHVGNAVAHLEVLDAVAHRDDFARALVADDERRGGSRIHPGAEIDVDEVDAAGVLLDADLPRARRTDIDVLISQRLGAAGLMHSDRCNHRLPPHIGFSSAGRDRPASRGIIGGRGQEARERAPNQAGGID